MNEDKKKIIDISGKLYALAKEFFPAASINDVNPAEWECQSIDKASVELQDPHYGIVQLSLLYQPNKAASQNVCLSAEGIDDTIARKISAAIPQAQYSQNVQVKKWILPLNELIK